MPVVQVKERVPLSSGKALNSVKSTNPLGEHVPPWAPPAPVLPLTAPPVTPAAPLAPLLPKIPPFPPVPP